MIRLVLSVFHNVDINIFNGTTAVPSIKPFCIFANRSLRALKSTISTSFGMSFSKAETPWELGYALAEGVPDNCWRICWDKSEY